ncbi:MAG: hypothetical protein CVV03_05360 [Firmicutes bacterium HGW-Firmicutes-8]|nr:MAG: hypothetical protein CVV03_05360 [Firmicutes bacterium HGW-Firmicutes-8]
MKITITKGPVMFLVSSFLFAVMGAFVKLASPFAPANEIAFVGCFHTPGNLHCGSYPVNPAQFYQNENR